MTMVLSPSPEQGQLVSVRSRRWVVSEVHKSSLPPKSLELGPSTN